MGVEGRHLKVEAGESVAVTGPSGAGKTTLLNIALGLLQPTEGEVLYGGQRIQQLGLQNVRRQIGTVDMPRAAKQSDRRTCC
ncbi:MAG: ATP-binding cassette domain-containing protein [Inhella sp.]